MQMQLPWPPSVNGYWRTVTINGKQRTLISKRGRQYRATVRAIVRTGLPIAGRAAVVIEAFPPDRRVRDLDNILKSLLDSMTYAGVWHGDEQVDDLRIIRRPVTPPGGVVVTVTEIPA